MAIANAPAELAAFAVDHHVDLTAYREMLRAVERITNADGSQFSDLQSRSHHWPPTARLRHLATALESVRCGRTSLWQGR